MDHHLRCGGRIVGDEVRVRAARDQHVTLVEVHRHAAIGHHPGVATHHRHQAQRRLVLHPQRPRRVEHGPDEEGVAGPRPVEQPGQRVHGLEPRRTRMRLRVSAMFRQPNRPNTRRMTELTLVLGGTGKTGRRVAQQLADRGAAVRVGSRSGEPPFHWEDPATWEPAVRGVTAVYITYQPDLAFPGGAEVIGAFAKIAVDAGARRLVLLSGRGEEETWPAEQAVRDSGAAWTILRCNLFAQNFSEAFLLSSVLAGAVALPSPDVPEPFVDVDDVAEAAVAALTDDRHANRLYELSGPRALTFAEATAEISAATGRDVRYVPVTVDEFAATAVEYAGPEAAGALATLFAKVLDGRNSQVTDGVQQLTGHPARDFRDYVRVTAAAGAWR
jgi:uncharacterized protein YbjT (DUF2867 family)